MEGALIVGFICLGFLVLFFMFFMNRELFNKALKAIMVGVAVYALYVGVLVVDKYIREEITTYASIEEVIEKNYEGYDVSYVNDGSYYYLILENPDESKEIEYELIKFEDDKYTAYDTIARFSKGVKLDVRQLRYNRYCYSSRKFEYDINDVVVIIIDVTSEDDFYDIYDEYGVWNNELIDHRYFYINVIDKDDFIDDYRIFTDREERTYELRDYEFYHHKSFWWDEIEE